MSMDHEQKAQQKREAVIRMIRDWYYQTEDKVDEIAKSGAIPTAVHIHVEESAAKLADNILELP
jgi:hypothetical protein